MLETYKVEDDIIAMISIIMFNTEYWIQFVGCCFDFKENAGWRKLNLMKLHMKEYAKLEMCITIIVHKPIQGEHRRLMGGSFIKLLKEFRKIFTRFLMK